MDTILRLISVAEAARILGSNPRAVRRHIVSGTGPLRRRRRGPLGAVSRPRGEGVGVRTFPAGVAGLFRDPMPSSPRVAWMAAGRRQ